MFYVQFHRYEETSTAIWSLCQNENVKESFDPWCCLANVDFHMWGLIEHLLQYSVHLEFEIWNLIYFEYMWEMLFSNDYSIKQNKPSSDVWTDMVALFLMIKIYPVQTGNSHS